MQSTENKYHLFAVQTLYIPQITLYLKKKL